MKRTTLVVLIAIFSILLILLSCTLPIYIVTNSDDDDDDDDEKDITNTPTPTATITQTPTLTYTPTYEVTPTVSVSLDGPWTIWEGTDQQRLDLNFFQDGFSVTANAGTDDGYSILYEGVISYDGYTVSGEWESTNGLSGTFVMYLDGSYGVFSGNMGGGVPFCGNRMNTSKPSPCLQ